MGMKSYRIGLAFMAWLFLSLILVFRAGSSDHADTPLLIDAGRNDARITDMYAFTKGSGLVLILCVDPSVPVGATNYQFPTDVEYVFNIDNDAEVDADGKILDTNNIHEDISIKIRFRKDGTPDISGYVSNFFAGPRDDPFIRTPRIGKNVAAIVVEVPLDVVLNDSSTLIIWASTKVDGFPGKFQERFGSPFISQVIPGLNTIHPKDDVKKLGLLQPDVTIIDTSVPSGFPNGRLLEDDVVDIVCPGFCDGVLQTDDPNTTENDVLFLQEFPYLAGPH